jgi:pyrrolysine biosynthesis protein PylC
MILDVVGGKLQGVEACYLARKSGWEVRLTDMNPVPPALGLCDSFVQFDVTREDLLDSALEGAQMVLPALEDKEALRCLKQWCDRNDIPLLFDLDAFTITSSKTASNRLFENLELPVPARWPGCELPVIVKPDTSSGSRDVELYRSLCELENRLQEPGVAERTVSQEYVNGRYFSLEIEGFPGHYQPLQVTELQMDERFDCKRVIAPAELASHGNRFFEECALRIAESVKLEGLMDVEAVQRGEDLRILEIDARLPSQTPIAVYWSVGINMVQLLAEAFLARNKSGSASATDHLDETRGGEQKSVLLEHIEVSGGGLVVRGEHVMGNRGPLYVRPGFYGANEAITDFVPGKSEWVATLINRGSSKRDVWRRREHVVQEIMKDHELSSYADPEPADDQITSNGS